RVRPAARSPVRRRARAAGTGGALGRRAEPPPAPLGGEPPDLAGVERRPDRPAARFAPPAPAGPGPPVAAGLLPLLPARYPGARLPVHGPVDAGDPVRRARLGAGLPGWKAGAKTDRAGAVALQVLGVVRPRRVLVEAPVEVA